MTKGITVSILFPAASGPYTVTWRNGGEPLVYFQQGSARMGGNRGNAEFTLATEDGKYGALLFLEGFNNPGKQLQGLFTMQYLSPITQRRDITGVYHLDCRKR